MGFLISNFDVGVTIYFEDKIFYKIPLNSIFFSFAEELTVGQKAPVVPDSRTKAVSLRLQYGKVRKKETDESRKGGGTTSPLPPL